MDISLGKLYNLPLGIAFNRLIWQSTSRIDLYVCNVLLSNAARGRDRCESRSSVPYVVLITPRSIGVMSYGKIFGWLLYQLCSGLGRRVRLCFFAAVPSWLKLSFIRIRNHYYTSRCSEIEQW